MTKTNTVILYNIVVPQLARAAAGHGKGGLAGAGIVSWEEENWARGMGNNRQEERGKVGGRNWKQLARGRRKTGRERLETVGGREVKKWAGARVLMVGGREEKIVGGVEDLTVGGEVNEWLWRTVGVKKRRREEKMNEAETRRREKEEEQLMYS